jgi:N-methylhydantoinase B
VTSKLHSADNSVDPVLASVIDNSIKAATKEMGVSLIRTTSSIYFNAGDMCTGILDSKARLLCQVEYLPLMAYTFPPALKALIEFFGDEIYEGDVFIHNDVFYGCNQLQDLNIFKPIFHEGELCFWTSTKGHEQDLGGSILSGYNPYAKEVWEETIRIPPLKLQEKGVYRKDVWNMILANSRLPQGLGRDLKAQIGGCIVGERRIKQLISRYGLSKLRAHIDFILDSAEARCRSAIAKIPEGSYQADSQTQNDGLSDETYSAQLTATVRNGHVTLDFTGHLVISTVYSPRASPPPSRFSSCAWIRTFHTMRVASSQ